MKYDESYNFEHEKIQNKKILYVANQFIHSSLFSIAYDKAKNWDSFYVVSDYDKEKYIWRVPANQIHDCFKFVSEDYLRFFSYEYDEIKKKYITDVG